MRFLLTLCATLAMAAQDPAPIVVNGKTLTAAEWKQVQELGRRYRVKVIPGRYWYDARSGLWGYEGKPAMGAILPGLRLGGDLSARASNGNTGVFVNGRELHLVDIQAVSRCTVVNRGRYWMDAYGNGGHEGQPAAWNLVQLCRQNAPSALGAPGNRGWYGNVSGDGQMVGAVFSDGAGVTCGPDGGCVY
ncbi:MAG: hypothetical protein JNK48_16970 [Bryobacterales bacterium]|nr:hypothetical protein [Bryobacterales bacterium]